MEEEEKGSESSLSRVHCPKLIFSNNFQRLHDYWETYEKVVEEPKWTQASFPTFPTLVTRHRKGRWKRLLVPRSGRKGKTSDFRSSINAQPPPLPPPLSGQQCPCQLWGVWEQNPDASHESVRTVTAARPIYLICWAPCSNIFKHFKRVIAEL